MRIGLPSLVIIFFTLVSGGCGSGEVAPVVKRAGESVGIEGTDPTFIPFVPEGAPLPTSRSEMFTTGVDNQSEITVKVYTRRQQQPPQVLGTFVVEGVAPARAWFAQVVVTFHVEADGMVRLSAVDKASGRETRKELGRIAVSE